MPPPAGGSRIGGAFDVINNFITQNGNDTNGQFGGLRIDTNTPGNRVIHNTSVRNDSDPAANPLYADGFYGPMQPRAQAARACDLAGSQISNEDTRLAS